VADCEIITGDILCIQNNGKDCYSGMQFRIKFQITRNAPGFAVTVPWSSSAREADSNVGEWMGGRGCGPLETTNGGEEICIDFNQLNREEGEEFIVTFKAKKFRTDAFHLTKGPKTRQWQGVFSYKYGAGLKKLACYEKGHIKDPQCVVS